MYTTSPLAWLLIGFIILFTGSLFLWLFSTKEKQNHKQNNAGHVMNKMIEAIKDPFAEENKKLSELAEATKNLQEMKKDK